MPLGKVEKEKVGGLGESLGGKVWEILNLHCGSTVGSRLCCSGGLGWKEKVPIWESFSLEPSFISMFFGGDIYGNNKYKFIINYKSIKLIN